MVLEAHSCAPAVPIKKIGCLLFIRLNVSWLILVLERKEKNTGSLHEMDVRMIIVISNFA
jgi:hypothetical protein